MLYNLCEEYKRKVENEARKEPIRYLKVSPTSQFTITIAFSVLMPNSNAYEYFQHCMLNLLVQYSYWANFNFFHTDYSLNTYG